MIQITLDRTTQQNDSKYRQFVLASAKQEISVLVVSGSNSYVNVTVNNASHQAYRGAGKQFTGIDAALLNYKSADIKSMLEYVKEQIAGEK